ncbi:hypothetical protein [[Mycoplasma] mobile]|uniref:Expressed protein n=1 Tax=Mycoplasma mobile (strain ATCC 43663 / 163K / NCTC 11711) TaxID=267748 RepID=Q6KH49_MYCM1|nr:hypothetical protein [[Mycoplasma] mobile]AAT28082.1 expressed protein [Mycoplasma mobile 163K]
MNNLQVNEDQKKIINNQLSLELYKQVFNLSSKASILGLTVFLSIILGIFFRLVFSSLSSSLSTSLNPLSSKFSLEFFLIHIIYTFWHTAFIILFSLFFSVPFWFTYSILALKKATHFSSTIIENRKSSIVLMLNLGLILGFIGIGFIFQFIASIFISFNIKKIEPRSNLQVYKFNFKISVITVILELVSIVSIIFSTIFLLINIFINGSLDSAFILVMFFMSLFFISSIVWLFFSIWIFVNWLTLSKNSNKSFIQLMLGLGLFLGIIFKIGFVFQFIASIKMKNEIKRLKN